MHWKQRNTIFSSSLKECCTLHLNGMTALDQREGFEIPASWSAVTPALHLDVAASIPNWGASCCVDEAQDHVDIGRHRRATKFSGALTFAMGTCTSGRLVLISEIVLAHHSVRVQPPLRCQRRCDVGGSF